MHVLHGENIEQGPESDDVFMFFQSLSYGQEYLIARTTIPHLRHLELRSFTALLVQFMSFTNSSITASSSLSRKCSFPFSKCSDHIWATKKWEGERVFAKLAISPHSGATDDLGSFRLLITASPEERVWRAHRVPTSHATRRLSG